MKYQLGFFSEYLDPIVLKEGKKSCPCCGRQMKAFGYTLNDDLIKIAVDIMAYCQLNKTKFFRSKDVSQDHKFLSQFQKLKLFKIINKEPKSSHWYLTKAGYSFLKGNISLPKKVWVFNNKVILEEDEFVDVGIAKQTENWKRCQLDWCLDYILHPYKNQLAIEELTL